MDVTVKLVITVRAIVFGFHVEVFQLTPKVCAILQKCGSHVLVAPCFPS